MADDFDDFDLPEPPMPADGDAAGALDQAGIDALFGEVGQKETRRTGVRAVIETNVVNHDRLPMLEVIFDRTVRTFATSMRNFTTDAIEVSLEGVDTVRFGDYMNHIALPAMIGVFRVSEWGSVGLITVDAPMIYAVVDALLGGRRGSGGTMIDGRGFTTIETRLVSRMIEVILSDISQAFSSIAPAEMKLERVETSPRFAAIAGPTNVCAAASFRVDMEGRGGRFSILLPYATLEPVRDQLLDGFMGEAEGGLNIWETHMEEEIRRTNVELDVVLGETEMRLADIRALSVGQAIRLSSGPEDPMAMQCGGIDLAPVQIGRLRQNVAVRLLKGISETSS
ncbi:flagellar motor switch protein FliM [Pacificimonas flava]|uniref:Flagellar motor switch protein FliM n=2 Tax=Pacificimonas TaxID=1960290 RepID=A0A219B5X9_9SPHN|nr:MULTISPECIES: flagellar motor switch protein FliM [Pacificimonas]MBZ6379233.1 flagellar motor switch protein FliM [Pacificimonas aurantium]OWV33553.1 flagellar motor switch protein FliM [Pacificimonas flava]